MNNDNKRFSFSVTSLLVFGLVTFLASLSGFLIAQKFDSGVAEIPPIVLNADSAARGKQISLATGVIDDEVEGLFVLDHLSGNLQCWVMNRRSGDIGAVFTGSASAELGGQKGGAADYVMTTGRIEFVKGSGQAKPAGCICYVADGNSGKVVGFGFRYNAQLAAKGERQRPGTLTVVCRGVTRENAARRDQE